tara:strand:+ start:2734 stop:3768 length:1035 start_codon:yes stop_codon:yes gene_type:complete
MNLDKYIDIALQFLPESSGKDIQIFSVDSGLINHTFHVKNKVDDYILQKLNHKVFSNPKCIHDNYEIVRSALVNSSYSRELLFFLKNKNNLELVCCDNEFWRMSKRIRGITYDICRSEEMAHHSAQTLAEFHKGLINVTGIDSPISRFTDFQYRIEQFNRVLSNGSHTRLNKANDLIGFVESNLKLIETYLKVEKSLPARVIHGDPKVSNFLFDEQTSSVNALIDMDTLMPGSILYDFGDMVRSFASILSEDDNSDGSKFSPVIYNSLLEGYLTHGSEFLIQEEIEGLPLSILSVSLIQGIRFLTDYIDNDVYYRVFYRDQNLHRAKNQFRFYSEAQDHVRLSY